MKQWLFIALCVGLLSSLVACGSSNQANETSPTSEVVASTLPPHMATIKGDVFEVRYPSP